MGLSRFTHTLILVAMLITGFARAEAQTTCGQHVEFINGILNTSDTASDSVRELFRQLSTRARCESNPVPCFTVVLRYNETSGLLRDLYESSVQAAQEPGPFWRYISGARVFGDPFQDMLAERLLAIASTPVYISAITHAADSPLVSHAEARYSQLSAHGVKVVVVAHSQGNFFANEIYRRLDSSAQQDVRIVSVAPPTEMVEGGGPHTRLIGDVLEVLGNSLDSNLRFTSSFPPVPACGTTTPTVADPCEGVTANSVDCHNFKDAYLGGVRPRRRILNHVLNLNDRPVAGILATGTDALSGVDLFAHDGGTLRLPLPQLVTLTARYSTDLDGREAGCSSEVPYSCIKRYWWSIDGQPQPLPTLSLVLWNFGFGSHTVALEVQDDLGALSEVVTVQVIVGGDVSSGGTGIDHLSTPTVFDNARNEFGQSFVATDNFVTAVRVYVDDPTRPTDPSVNELVGPAYLKLLAATDLLHPVELRRTLVLDAGAVSSGLVTYQFDEPVPTIPGSRYFFSIETADGYGVGVRLRTASTYGGGAQAYRNCLADICSGAYPVGAVIEDPNGRDLSFAVLTAH